MTKRMGEQGQINALLVPVILLALLFMGAAGSALWAYGGRQDYKDNVDAKIQTAVAANTKTVQTTDAKQYAAAAKNPLTLYSGPDAFGSVKAWYPKTWSAYVDTNGGAPLDAYFRQGYVPSVNSKQTYNLRIKVVSQTYDSVLSPYQSKIKTGAVTAAPYSLPKVPSVVGTRLTGAVLLNQANGGAGSMVVLPLRNTTLEIWTESNDYLPDFNTYILPNLSFSP